MTVDEFYRGRLLKSKIVLNLLWNWRREKVSFSRSRKYKPTKLSWLQNKTSRHILVSFEVISLKQCPSFSPFNFIKEKTWFEMFLWLNGNQTHRIFLFLHIPLAIHRIFRNWYQIFYNRSGSHKIQPIFIFLWFIVSMEISITLKNTFTCNQTLIFFQKLV